MKRTTLTIYILAGALTVGPYGTTDAKPRLVTVNMSRSACAVATESESRTLDEHELEVVANDALARYTFVRLQVDRAMQGLSVQALPEETGEDLPVLPLSLGTERLLEQVFSGSPGDKEFASFLRSNCRKGRYVVYIARRGNLSKEEKSVFEEFQFRIGVSNFGKYYDLLKREPPALEDKLDFLVSESRSGPVILRLIELGGGVVDELADRMAACVAGPLETPDDANTAILGLEVLAALGDPRLRKFPIDHFLESGRIAESFPAWKKGWRAKFEKFQRRGSETINPAGTKSFMFLTWSRSIPREVRFEQVE